MSVINRIEIANWLDLTRTREWNPDYRHVVLDFRGQSTAVQAHNGTGKTRMTRAILALLGRDREFTGDARAKMAPRSAPCGSHIRMEVVHPLDSGQASLTRSGGEVAGGERYVLGIYGYSGEGQRVTFYKYDGRLEDCPVAVRDGHRVTLVPDDTFRRSLKGAKGALIDPSEEEWLIEIGKHFDRGNIRQIIEYQKKGAGDGTSNFLKVKSKHGERYDEAFFYSVLAPELLVGTMGNEALEGERRFEDTILISARKIGMALAESRRRQNELLETKRALDAIERVNVAARDVTAARQTYEVRCRTLAGEAAFLQTVVIERPVPGIPKCSLPPDEKTREIAAHLRIQDDVWRLPDWAVGVMTGEEPARVNERAARTAGRGVSLVRAQAIEIPVRITPVPSQAMLYPVDTAGALIGTASGFAPGWSKDTAKRALEAAFQWAEAEADTNFPRKHVFAFTRQRTEAGRKYREVEQQRKEVDTELDRLHSRQRSMDAARHAYDEMARSGLFSDAELAAPSKTGAMAEEHLRLAETRLEEHQRRVAAETALYARWNAFLSENGRDANPGSLADEIEAAKRTATDGLDQARRNHKDAERRRNGISVNLQAETRRLQQSADALNRITAERRLAQKFVELFPGEAVAGLLERVKRELREASDQKARLESRIAAATGPLRQLAAFRAVFPGQNAVEVSTRRARRRDEMVGICAELDKNYEDVQRRRSELERAQIAAGQVEDCILRTAGKGALPLYAAVSGLDLPPDRRRLVLTHFSGLLFAPILETVEEADLVANVLFSEGIPAPVLVRSELEAFCRDGDIKESEGSAYSYILGARTRPVDCLLDPGLVEREKRELEERAAKLKAELAAALQEKAALAPGHSDTRLVEDARKSEEDRLEETTAQAAKDVAEIDVRLPRLEERASEESVATIRATERYASLGGEERYNSLLAEQHELSEKIAGLEAETIEAGTLLEHAELSVKNAEALFSRVVERASQVPGLRDLSRFVREGGPAFMQAAPGVGLELRKARDQERTRTKFQFELAQQRIELAQGAVDGIVLLQRRILSPKSGEPVFAADGEPSTVRMAANRSVANWCQLTLRPWAEKLGIDCGDVELLETRGLRGELFDEIAGADPLRVGEVLNATASTFRAYADPLLGIVSRLLEGAELFPGLGPVHRIIDAEYGNTISFETWPAVLAGGDDLYSMVANVSIETRPSSRSPFVVIRAMRRIWCREFPKPNQLFGRSRISVRVAQRGRLTRAVTLSVELSKGEPAARVNAAMFEAQRSSGETVGDDVAELVRSRGRGPDMFVGVPFRYGYRPIPAIETGVTVQDQIDLTRRITERIAPYGFELSPIRVLPAVKRPSEHHQAVSLFNLITHHFGRVEEADVSARVEELFGAPERKSKGGDKPVKTVDLEPLVGANQERLDKAFGKALGVTLVFVCRRENEEQIFRSVVSLLFGNRVKVVRYALPEGVHGTKKTLDGASLSRVARAALRRDAWKPLAEQIKSEHPGTPVIVQAAREYEGLDDDSVNKDMGRNTLATIAGCSVQYLLPPGSGKAAEYMHRVQAALYDLLFAHSGLGPTPWEAVREAFAEPARPRIILGISVVSQAASRTGRPDGAELAVALKVDAATGAILGRFGRLAGKGFDTGRFQVMSRTLVDVAAAGSTSLGPKLEDRRRNFLRFIRSVLDEVSSEDPNAVVIIESTQTRSLWAWLSDEHIGEQVFLEDRSARPPTSWSNLRFIRLRERAAGRLAVQKGRRWLPVTRQGDQREAPTHHEVYGTAIDRLVESVPDAGVRTRHYLCAHGFGIRNRGARGQSVYRQKDGFQRVGSPTPKKGYSAGKVLFKRAVLPPWDKPSRIPGTLEITVLPSAAGDDSDATASLIATLRNGYSHTADGTYLPAPLSFKSKILDYMDRYGTGSDTDTDELADEHAGDPGEDTEADSGFKEQPLAYGELRRWFEGSPEFGDHDVPEFDEEETDTSTLKPKAFGADVTSAGQALWPTPDQVRQERPEARSASSSGIRNMQAPQGGPAKVTPDQRETVDDISKLLQAVRTPTARLPDFVTEEFLASVSHFVNSDIRRMHEDRAWIRAVTGFPWPEERPGTEEMPQIYLEALKYPAFAIVVQHQFFTDDYSRGLPKNQIRRQYSDLAKRARREKPLPRGEENLFVLGALRSREIGGDLNLILAELVGLPGNGAWGAPCRKACDGLSRLETAAEFKQIAIYLRDVVGPFGFINDGRTIGEVFEQEIIPVALKAAQEAKREPEHALAEAKSEQRTSTEAKPELAQNLSQFAPVPRGAVASESIEQLSLQWKSTWDTVSALAADAGPTAPCQRRLSQLTELLNQLAEIEKRAAVLVPARRPIQELQSALRETISAAESGLAELIGEQSSAPKLLSLVGSLPREVAIEKFDKASALQIEAKDAVRKADDLAAEIEKIESSLPLRQARQKTASLIDSQEDLLRNALDLCRQALRELPEADLANEDLPESTAPTPSGASAASGVIESAPSTSSRTEQPIDVASGEEDDLLEQVPDVAAPDTPEPYEENPVFAPPVQPVPDLNAEDERPDPLYDDILHRLDQLFAVGEHGLAFHLLQAASHTVSDAVYTSAELRLAASSGRVLGLSGQDLQTLMEARGEALSTAQQLAEQDDDRSLARLNLLLAGSIPAALFRPDDIAAVSLVEGLADKKQFAHYSKIIGVVDENRKRGFPLTPANLLALDAHSRADGFVAEAVTAIKSSIENFKSSRFRFQLGEKLKHSLIQPHGLLGQLASKLTESDVAMAREVAEKLDGRDKIVTFVDKTTDDIATGEEVDGVARDRILNFLSQVGQRCRDLVQAVDGYNSLRRSGGRLDAIERLRDLAVAGIAEALAETEISGTLLGASRVQSTVVLQSLSRLLQGGMPDRESPPLAVGLHGPLLWLPNLSWTGGWTPSPYDLERLLQEILSVPVPLLGKDPSASVVAAFEARRAESAFVPAHMLLSIAHWQGVPQSQVDDLRAKIDADKEAKKDQVAARLRNANRTIDKMRRMAVGSLDQSARLKEMLSVIDPNKLPVEIPSNFLPESLEGDRIQDFNSALSRISEVESEAQREFEKARADHALQITELEGTVSIDEDTKRELKNLLDRHEFTTLADWLNMIRTGSVRKPVLPSGAVNKRLAAFKLMLPQLGSVEPLQVARAVESGGVIGPLHYRHLDSDRREEGARVLRRFPELKRLAKDQRGERAQLQPKLVELLSQLLYDVSRCTEDLVLTRFRQQIFVFDVALAMPSSDPTSLILPEFGSLTQGAWRACVVTPTISIQGLVDLAEGAGLRGTVAIYLGVLSEEKRNQLRVELTKRKRALLVIDEALVAAAIADSEDRRRAIFEIGQGYSSADPYKDHGKSAVPAEMFKGRSAERSAIVDPFGSYVVYGGRRLGKTALLQHIHATQPQNALFVYVDLDMIAESSDAFEQISKKLNFFRQPARASEVFSSAVMEWLQADERRRILLLLDEADRFVRHEAESEFRCIQTLLQLMAETKNRFKFVLAGLHNVSRSIRAENSPLVQIANNPLQIGPLLNRDVDDAEFLVRGPLAAMGFEFDNREDVWRILSFTNYYPVLIQVFCQELLRLIQEQAVHTGSLPGTISTTLVERALSSSDVRKKLFASFEKTIGSIENRYELITYILAAHELIERESGMKAEGMTTAEVADRAMECWPAAFTRGSDPTELEYLLEEMEGFGIARRTLSPGTFALRSRSLLELMAASEADLNRKLDYFKSQPKPPKPFDPKNFRRILGKTAVRPDSDGRTSPLTDGQEADLLAPTSSSQLSTGIGVVFGSAYAGIKYVDAALLESRRAKDKMVEIDLKIFADKKEMLDEAKKPTRSQKPRVLVVSVQSPWRPDWIVDAERVGRVRKAETRIVFVGDMGHAKEWAKDSTVLRRVLPQIKLVKLRPWTRSYLGSRIESMQLSVDLVDRISKATGGWSEITGPLLDKIAARPHDVNSLVTEEASALSESNETLGRLGIPSDLLEFYRELAQYADGSTITTSDFQFLCTSDERRIAPKTVGLYSDLMGIISFPPDHSAGQPSRRVDLNSLALAALLRRG